MFNLLACHNAKQSRAGKQSIFYRFSLSFPLVEASACVSDDVGPQMNAMYNRFAACFLGVIARTGLYIAACVCAFALRFLGFCETLDRDSRLPLHARRMVRENSQRKSDVFPGRYNLEVGKVDQYCLIVLVPGNTDRRMRKAASEFSRVVAFMRFHTFLVHQCR
jgi:hypothetical protein